MFALQATHVWLVTDKNWVEWLLTALLGDELNSLILFG